MQEPGKLGADGMGGGEGGGFPATSWTDLRALGVGVDPARQRDALQRLCQRYWKPIHAFIRRRGSDEETAKDLTQDFFHHLLTKERLKLADRSRGRFRSFVLTALNHFLASDWARRTAKKRDERVVVPLATPGASEPEDEGGGSLWEPRDAGDTPDQAFDDQWAREVLMETRRRLEAELDCDGRRELRRLLPFAVHDGGEDTYPALAAELGRSEAALRKAVERLRSRWRTLFLGVVADTVPTRSEVEAEARELLEILRRRG